MRYRTISQFGIGFVSIGQCAVDGHALAQFAVVYALIAQMGIFIHEGYGQLLKSLMDLIKLIRMRMTGVGY